MVTLTTTQKQLMELSTTETQQTEEQFTAMMVVPLC